MGEGTKKRAHKGAGRDEKEVKQKKERKGGEAKKQKKETKATKAKKAPAKESDADVAMAEASAPAPSLSAALASLARPTALAAKEEERAVVAALFSTAAPAPLPTVAEVVSSFKAPTTKAQKRKRSATEEQPLIKRVKTSDDPAALAKSLDEQALRAGEIRRAKKQQAKEDEHKTIFVGNVAIAVTRKMLEKHFKRYGVVKSVRLRSLPIGTMKLSRKACAITGNFHDQRDSCNAYVVFETIEAAMAALESNGDLLEGKHIRVDRIVKSTKDNRARDVASIFIGNLPFDVEEEELWALFGVCGAIDGVRVVRDRVTNQGKGIAYVAFKDGKASVAAALQKFSGGVKLRGRELRLEKIAKRSKLAKPEEKKRNREAALKRSAVKASPLGGKPTGRPVQGDHVKGALVKAGKMRRSEAPSYQGKMAQEGKIPRMKLGADKAKKYKAKPAKKKKKTVRSGKR